MLKGDMSFSLIFCQLYNIMMSDVYVKYGQKPKTWGEYMQNCYISIVFVTKVVAKVVPLVIHVVHLYISDQLWL